MATCRLSLVSVAIHLAHPALADLRDDFVDAEAGAGGEGQKWRDYTSVTGCKGDRSCLIGPA